MLSEKQRIEKEVGITPGDTWEHVVVQVLLWLDKKFSEINRVGVVCNSHSPQGVRCQLPSGHKKLHDFQSEMYRESWE